MFSWKTQQKKGSLLSKSSFCTALIPSNEERAKIEFSPTSVYDDKTDLTIIHEYVINNFKTQKKNIPTLEQTISQIEAEMKKEDYTIIEKKQMFNKINKLKDTIKEYKSDEQLNEYNERIERIYGEWKRLKVKINKNIFGVQEIFSPQMLSLVRTFIQTASEYCKDLDMSLGIKNKYGFCPYCRTEYNQSDPEKIICEICNIYENHLNINVTYGDIDRINSSNVNNYHNEENFEKAIDILRGNVEANFPKGFFEKCDEYCNRHNIDKKTLLPEHARLLFKELKFSDYDTVHLFLYQYIERELLNFDKYIPIIKQDNKIFSPVYEEVKEDRESALNAQFVLFLLLRRRGFPCRRGDFKIPNTPDILRSSEKNARKAFEKLGWEYESLC